MRHRQRAQISPLALFAMVVLVGTVALVVDAGIFFVTQRQLQTAADAAALAASWYAPVCKSADNVHCAQPPMPTLPPPPAGWPSCTQDADCVADAVAIRNLGFTGALCRNVTISPPAGSRTDAIPNLTTYIVTLDCDAPYWFARIFPTIPVTAHLRAFAKATVAREGPRCDLAPATVNDRLMTCLLS